MTKLKTTDLLEQLSEMEASLHDFSFEELNTQEASELKSSFNKFKKHLNNKIFGAVDSANKELNLKEEKGNRTHTTDNKLIAHVSHEIRTPLNGIIGFTDLLREEQLTPSQLKKVDAIQSASLSLMDIINEVLEYSKLASGTEGFVALDFNFRSLVKDVMFLCQTLVVNSAVSLELVISNNIPEIIIGDPSKLSQVLLNILGNAIKFVEKGQIKLSIDLKEIRNEQYIIAFSIEDTGIGMSKEQLEIIFESFKQADKDTFQKYGGSGLGLSIVKEIIEKQGGSIEVKSILGTGTTFRFCVPFAKGNSNNIPQSKTKTVSVEKGRKLLGGTKILIFEDNLLNQHLISEQLKKWDCEIYVTANAQEGIGLLQTKTIDIILMDLKMPEMSGFKVSKSIRSLTDPKINQIPIIAFSADFTAQDHDRCRSVGINDFLLKPYTLSELMIKLLKRKKKISLTEASLQLLKLDSITASELESVDLSLILKECFNDIQMLAELIRLFKQNVYEFIGAVKIGISNQNLEEVYFATHKMRAGLALMNTKDLLNSIIGIEEGCKNEELAKVENFFNKFLEQYPKKEAMIDLEFNKLKQA